jgi:hypothetical protein
MLILTLDDIQMVRLKSRDKHHLKSGLKVPKISNVQISGVGYSDDLFSCSRLLGWGIYRHMDREYWLYYKRRNRYKQDWLRPVLRLL